MKSTRLAYALSAAFFLTACVTVNIYFPAAQAQEAAEKIVEDILSGTEKDAPAQTPPSGEKQSFSTSGFLRLLGPVLDALVPPAHAAAPDFSVDTPEIRKLQASMKARNASLKPYYADGAVGFTRDALVGIKDPSAVPLRERRRVEKLVAAESRDRNALYRAIAGANGHPKWEAEVRATFARTWVEKAETGWWYQDAQGKWRQK
jgi:uncharacterized protein YdbL (DUF1318 family)